MSPGPFRSVSAIVLSMLISLVGCTANPAKPAISTPAITTTVEAPNDLEREVKLYHLQVDGRPVSLRVIQFKDGRFPPELLYGSGDPSVPCSSARAKDSTFESFRQLFEQVLKASNYQPEYSLYLPCYPEVDARMTALAAADPHWQTLQRQNSPPSIVYAFLGKLLTRDGIAPELNHALADTGYTAQIDPQSLEKLWTTSAAKLTSQQKMFVHGPPPANVDLPTEISKAFLLTKGRG